MSATVTLIRGLELPDLAKAACKGDGSDRWFPDAGAMPPGDLAELRAVCGRCPVREACLEYALQGDILGVWAGTTRSQRKPLLRKRTVGCAGCDATFRPIGSQKYCSERCGERHRRANGSRSDLKRDTCREGHPLTPTNVDMTIGGHRRCRTCRGTA